MNIAIIGAGNVGGALGGSWAKAGHRVVFGVREPDSDRTKKLLADTGHGATAQAVAAAAKGADVVVLATPWDAVEDALTALGDLGGKVLIDCTNPLQLNAEGSLSLSLGSTTSGAEEIAAKARGAKVAKAFNTYGWENFANASYPGYGNLKPVMFFCSDSDEAKEKVHQLAADLGFEPMDTGGLGMARSLEDRKSVV